MRATAARPIGVTNSGSSGDLALLLVDDEVLHNEDGVVIADGGLQQALGVGRVRRGDDLQSGRAREPRFEALRVLGGELVAGAVGRADDQWAPHLAAEHRADLGRVVDDLVHGDEQEVEGHDLDDGALAEHRGADTRADEALLGDRGVAHAVGPEFVKQARGDLVGALEDPDLLAHDEDALVAPELLAQRQAHGFAVGHDLGLGGERGHRPRPASKTRSSSSNGLPGCMRSNCSALPGAYTPAANSSTSGASSAAA